MELDATEPIPLQILAQVATILREKTPLEEVDYLDPIKFKKLIESRQGYAWLQLGDQTRNQGEGHNYDVSHALEVRVEIGINGPVDTLVERMEHAIRSVDDAMALDVTLGGLATLCLLSAIRSREYDDEAEKASCLLIYEVDFFYTLGSM